VIGRKVDARGRSLEKRRGVPPNLTDEQIRAAHLIYVKRRLSFRALGKLLYAQFGYKSPRSCANSLCDQFKRLGIPARDRIEATVLASTTHGLAPRGARGAEFRAHRRKLRLANGDIRGVRCAGVVSSTRARESAASGRRLPTRSSAAITTRAGGKS